MPKNGLISAYNNNIRMNKTLLFLATSALCLASANAQTLRNGNLKPEFTATERTIKAPLTATAQSLVTDPKGIAKDYGMSLYIYVNALQPDYDEYDLKSPLVFSTDGSTVWFKNLFMDNLDGYAKGEISGNKVTIKSGQYVANSDTGSKLYLLAFTVSDSSATLADGLTLSFSNGHMRSTDDDVYLGLFTYNEAAKSYSLASTYAHTYIFDEVTSTATTVPDGATVEKYMLNFYDNWRGGDYKRVVDVARQGDVIYINGLSFDSREDYIKGTVEDDEAIFESGQALFNNPSFWLRLDGAKVNGTSYVGTTDFSFAIAADGAMTLNQDALCEKYMFDGGNYDVITKVKLTKYAGDVAAVPATPQYLKCVNSSYGLQTTFVLPLTDENGAEINPDNLYYRIYLDGSVYTFTPADYQGVTEAMSLVPCYYYNSYTFNEVYRNRYKLFYFSDTSNWKKMEVESVYIVDGVENVSAGRSSATNPNASVSEVDADANIVKVAYTDLLGRKADASQGGQVLIKTTVYDNGTVTREKVATRNANN